MAPIEAQDLTSVAGVWQQCFAQDARNFTVIVEPSADEEGSEGKRAEFKVWAPLLSHSSPVFETMLSSENYVESKEGQVVIQDFASEAVEVFLRFLYSGVVRGSLGLLVQVAAMADKYQVGKLHALCLESVAEALTPEEACEVFAAADRFQVAALRVKALEQILIHPAEALETRPIDLDPELLQEILDSGLLCMEDADLLKVLRGWGKGKEGDRLQPLIDARIGATARKPGQHSEDVFGTLWQRYCNAGRTGGFLCYWVVVTLGPQQANMCGEDSKALNSVACGNVQGLSEGWVKWEVPRTPVHLMGFSFDKDIPSTLSFQIFCSEDGGPWHLAYSSDKQEIKAGIVLPCKKPAGLVKCFRLQVLAGQIAQQAYLCIHGILQTD